MPTPEKKAHRKRDSKRGERRGKLRSVRTWRFEQLESRAMLSATMGPMFYGPVVHSFDTHAYDDPHLAQAGMFAPQNFELRMEGPPEWNGWMNGPMQGGRHDDYGVMPGGFGDGPEMFDHGYAVPEHSALTSASKPTATNPAMTPNVITNTFVGPDFTVTVTQYIYSTPSTVLQLPAGGHQNPDPHPTGTMLVPYKEPVGGHEYDTAGKVTVPLTGGTVSPYGAAIAVPVLTQSMSREVELSSLVSSGALDAALQTYTSQLLLVSGAASSQITSTSTLNDLSTSTGDAADDFVRLSDLSPSRAEASNADALSREQATVEEVFQSLQGVDSLPSDTNESAAAHDGSISDQQDAQVTDLIFGTAFDVADNDGGMVLLQASGDANQSPINLANVAESHPGMFSPHVGVEVSVGFYQAVDRGFEEFSAVEILPTANTAPQPGQAKPMNGYSVGAGFPSQKSAGILTASTLLGGLLWCAGRKQVDKRYAKSQDKQRLAR
jgi:hypothetical protein